jgi:hypothetical protein
LQGRPAVLERIVLVLACLTFLVLAAATFCVTPA